FSGHKPGWMTDRGLLWIVFGPPPRVEPTPDGEDWVYKDVADAGGARFRFRRRPTLFAPGQLELRRERGFETVWYAATAQWRKGSAVTAVK
ncbi:MAG: GWxTD domain-containing protein, partial [Hymenobacteraceae bacterium]|nr:GWxTD domain-containing protein [Hymenobacteraceae bacterium]